MAAKNFVSRLPRSDSPGSFILVHVTPSGPATRPLNARLAATEADAVYLATLKHNEIDSLRIQSDDCSKEKWERILRFILLHDEPVEHVDAIGEVLKGKVVITFRQDNHKITTRLGTLTLKEKVGEFLELFDWCNTALERSAQIQLELVKAQAKSGELEGSLNELKDQLDELITAKNEDERVLLEKFRDLLNEKKVKIREQQRLIDAASGSGSASHNASSPAPGASRSAKRKARQAVSEDEDSDGFERMDVDSKQEPVLADEDRQTTDEEATASDEEDEDEPAPRKNNRAQGSKGTVGKAGNGQTSRTVATKQTDTSPKQALPLRQATTTAQQGSDTESDDEL